MTIKEFWERIDRIDLDSRDTGMYTEDEIFAIGCSFINLTNSQKRQIGGWDKLVKVLKPLGQNGKVMKNGEQLRGWIKAKRYEINAVPKNIQLLSGKTIENITYEEFEEEVNKQKRELYKQQVKTRDERNSYRRTVREDARVEMIRDAIKDAVVTLPEYKYPDKIDYDPKDNVEAVLLFSDLHIGSIVDNFFNKYNVEIARRRVKEIVNKTIYHCKKYNVQELHVLNLGDLIENDLHISARLEQEVDAVEQVMIACEILSEALKELSENIPSVTYRSCLDNHSRFIMDYKASKDEESLVKMIDWYLEERLSKSNIQFKNDNLDKHIGMFTLKNGEKMVFAHGHEIGINISLQSYMSATYSYIRYIALGHWHSTKMKTFQNSKVFINGSIKGLDSYAESHGLFGEPEQTLLIFEDNSLTNITINLKDIK